VAIGANLDPPPYLQALVVLSTTCGASTLAVPVLMACFWRRATARGVIAAMIAGSVTALTLYGIGWLHLWSLKQVDAGATDGLASYLVNWLGPDQGIGIESPFRPYFLLGLDPLIWGLLMSAIFGVAVTRCTAPPPAEQVAWMFEARRPRPANALS
jgi:SSS family solute:Na+ symporter/sodium/pantothenate symporter